MRALASLLCLVWFAVSVGPASAHEVRPGYLEIIERHSGIVDVTFKQPRSAAGVLRLEPRLSGDDRLSRKPDFFSAGDGYEVRTWRNVRLAGGPLSGRTISVPGLERTITDVLVDVQFADGHGAQALLRADRTSMPLELRSDRLPILAYLRLGVMHILTGYDHLMFVAGLMLLTPGIASLVRTITAFTVAHSITLAATVLGYVVIAPARIEIMVALSIVFVAAELMRARRGETSLTQRRPWLIAFGFGLLHGSAFAGALAEIGLPQGNVPAALLLFNGGVEIGQLLFILILCGVGFALTRLSGTGIRRLGWVPAYVIGIASCFWLFERFQASIV